MSDLSAALKGEVFRGTRGDMVASYHLDTETPPGLGEVQDAVERRVQLDAPTDRESGAGLRLAGWRGGWNEDKSGRWESEIYDARGEHPEKLGRVVLTVRVQRTSGSNWTFKRGS